MTDVSESGGDLSTSSTSASAPTNKQCFAPIQSRKIWSSSSIVSSGCCLCPSMDIVAITTPSSLFLHRTVSWQKLATLHNASDFHNCTATHVSWSPDGRALAIALSNGKIALYHIEGMSNSSSASGGGGSGGGGDPLMDEDGTNPNGRIHTVNDLLKQKDRDEGEEAHTDTTSSGGAVTALTWAHVGRPHSKWNFSGDEFEMEESWRYRSQYLDKSAMFLPPTSYQMEEEELNEGESNIKNTLPFACTPLSVLCVSTSKQGIHLYLHGRYHIATLPHSSSQEQQQDDHDGNEHKNSTTEMIQKIVSSSDLTHFVVQSTTTRPSATTTQLTMYSLPALKQHRYHLQTIASLYCSISSHLVSIRQHAKEVVASWKSSLKPLDMKLDGLTRLLKNYGVQQNVRTVLFRYIMVGHTSVSTEASNALDQFFTGVQMNDQLIQRLERSLHGAVGNVEALARKGVLAPARALVYDAGEIRGQCSAFYSTFENDGGVNNASSSSFLSSTCTTVETATCQLYQSCEILLITVERMIAQLVEARFRLRDLVSWLRSVGSQIKARGTAANSAHRENARKRRVPQVIIQRMATYLQPLSSLPSSSSPTITATVGGSVTECLLNVPLSDFFVDNPTFVVVERPPSPRSLLDDDARTSTHHHHPQKSPTISYAVSRVSDFCQKVFEQPRIAVSKSVSHTKIILEDDHNGSSSTNVGIHTRIGLDDLNHSIHSVDEEIDNEDHNISSSSKGFFQPRIWNDDNEGGSSSLSSRYSCSRQWTITAKMGYTADRSQYIQLFVFPMDMAKSNHKGNDARVQEGTDQTTSIPSYYLKTRIQLPNDCQVKEIGFYGDDGKSSLSSGADSGSGEEGRQALGLLIDNGKQSDDKTTAVVSEEFWLLSYDNLVFQPNDIMDSSSSASTSTLDDVIIMLDQSIVEECTVCVKPLCNDSQEDDRFVVYAKTRQLRVHESERQSEQSGEVPASVLGGFLSSRRLMLSGSRGIGGVFTAPSGSGSTLLDLLDLEEDAEGSDDEEEDGGDGSIDDE